jgi:hypothetical protein
MKVLGQEIEPKISKSDIDELKRYSIQTRRVVIVPFG